MPETVLIIGSTGNIGVSAIQSAQRLGWDILAVVRNQDSAKKIFDHVDKEGINTIEVDILADDGVAKIVEWARMGTLPAFQHVIAAGGGAYDDTPLKDITPQRMRELLHQNFDFAFLAYHATIPYLLEQGAASTFTLCTGAQGDFCRRGGPACTQGALYSMATTACRENAETNIRFNELYLALRVDFDEVAKKDGTMSTTDFSRAWDHVFRDQSLKSMRIEVQTAEDLDKLNAYSKIDEADKAEARSGH